MRLPHIPKIDWEPIWKFGTKLAEVFILLYKVYDMFDFLKSIKNRLALLESQVESILNHIKAEFDKKKEADAKPIDGDPKDAA